jgi:hypothetical protein
MKTISQILKDFEATGKFAAQEMNLTEEMTLVWVQFKTDPQRFLPQIFDGNWARPERHPVPGNIKLLRIIKGKDGISRAIGRQSNNIFATPWIA